MMLHAATSLCVYINTDTNSCSLQQFNSSSIFIRAQKKLLSKVVSRNLIKFNNDTTTRIFDSFYRILKIFYNKKIAELVGLLVRSGYFQNNKQKENLIVLQRQIRMLSLTIISFTTVAYSYDRNYLMVLLAKVRKKLQIIVSENLSEKSMQRLQIIFEYIEKGDFLDALFNNNDTVYKTILLQIIVDLGILIENNDI
ncbi:unnamed protein product [Dracunculus medinensis]|uniref:Tumor necrosis factor alpha-induced protein 8-like protein n=1 Tax=Dracunculus medinensis TaxID=318479 RepID=A0A0N4U603_DRAME|nr:unnamed protein product [Dracunculus medinensis]